VGSITYNEGEALLLTTFFQNEPPTMGPFYIGLGTGGAYLAENGTLNELNEVSGQGYERYRVERDASPAGWERRDNHVQSPELVFTNTHPVEDWVPIDYAFLTLSQEGVLSPAVLIAAVEFPHSIELGPTTSLKFHFRFSQTTNGPNRDRVHYAATSLLAASLVLATADGPGT
jgi:hypothetical protein